MVRAFLCGSALALTFSFAAQAQDPASQKDKTPPAAEAAGKDVTATSPTLKAGMVVKDSAGVTLGKISKLGKAPDGTEAAAVNVGGQTINLALSTLTVSPSGKEAVSSQTKAEIQAAAPTPK
jgi:hypothetical protein